MDFKPLKKDRKPGADGLFGWESPRLREALRAAKEAGKQMVAKGMTPTNYRTTKDVDMIARDLGAACLRKSVDDLEQAAFERWLEQEHPSGDVDQVQRAWGEVRDEWLGEEEPAAERGCDHSHGRAWRYEPDLARCFCAQCFKELTP